MGSVGSRDPARYRHARKRTCVRENTNNRRTGRRTGLSAYAVDDIPCSTVDRLIRCGISDVVVRCRDRIMIEEQRVVRVLLGIPIVEVRQRCIVPLEEILREVRRVW